MSAAVRKLTVRSPWKVYHLQVNARGRVTRTPARLTRMLGWHVVQVRNYCARAHWTTESRDTFGRVIAEES